MKLESGLHKLLSFSFAAIDDADNVGDDRAISAKIGRTLHDLTASCDHVLDQSDAAAFDLGALRKSTGAVVLWSLSNKDDLVACFESDGRGNRDSSHFERAKKFGVWRNKCGELAPDFFERSGLAFELVEDRRFKARIGPS